MVTHSVVIASDGINSTTRKMLDGPDPSFTRQVCQRTLVPMETALQSWRSPRIQRHSYLARNRYLFTFLVATGKILDIGAFSTFST